MNRGIALLIVLFTVAQGASAQIYKTVDANGNVVFTDIAPVDRSGQPAAQPVDVPPVNSYEPPVAATPAPADGSSQDAVAGSYYTEIDVVSPAEDETIRDNAGNVQVEVSLTPPLRAGHRLLLVLDGNPIEVPATNGVFELSNVDRGTHTAAVRAVDRQGNVLIESTPTTFNLMRVALGPEGTPPQMPTPH